MASGSEEPEGGAVVRPLPAKATVTFAEAAKLKNQQQEKFQQTIIYTKDHSNRGMDLQ